MNFFQSRESEKEGECERTSLSVGRSVGRTVGQAAGSQSTWPHPPVQSPKITGTVAAKRRKCVKTAAAHLIHQSRFALISSARFPTRPCSRFTSKCSEIRHLTSRSRLVVRERECGVLFSPILTVWGGGCQRGSQSRTLTNVQNLCSGQVGRRK